MFHVFLWVFHVAAPLAARAFHVLALFFPYRPRCGLLSVGRRTGWHRPLPKKLLMEVTEMFDDLADTQMIDPALLRDCSPRERHWRKRRYARNVRYHGRALCRAWLRGVR